jgi:hypothetical protein
VASGTASRPRHRGLFPPWKDEFIQLLICKCDFHPAIVAGAMRFHFMHEAIRARPEKVHVMGIDDISHFSGLFADCHLWILNFVKVQVRARRGSGK